MPHLQESAWCSMILVKTLWFTSSCDLTFRLPHLRELTCRTFRKFQGAADRFTSHTGLTYARQAQGGYSGRQLQQKLLSTAPIWQGCTIRRPRTVLRPYAVPYRTVRTYGEVWQQSALKPSGVAAGQLPAAFSRQHTACLDFPALYSTYTLHTPHMQDSWASEGGHAYNLRQIACRCLARIGSQASERALRHSEDV